MRPVFVILGAIVFLAFYVTSFSSLLATWGQLTVTNNNLTGFTAMFYTYINVWVFLIFLIALIGGLVSGE